MQAKSQLETRSKTRKRPPSKAKTAKKPKLVASKGEKLDFDVPADFTGPDRLKYIDMVSALRAAHDPTLPADYELLADALRSLLRAETFHVMSMTAADAGDVKTFASLSTLADRAGASARSGLVNLSLVPDRRSSTKMKQLAGQTHGEKSQPTKGKTRDDDDGGWDDLL